MLGVSNLCKLFRKNAVDKAIKMKNNINNNNNNNNNNVNNISQDESKNVKIKYQMNNLEATTLRFVAIICASGSV
jgi:hypothetical protein